MSDTARTSSGGVSRFDRHNLVATYATPEEARAALAMLERKGVEAGDIELFGPGMRAAGLPITNDEQQAADMKAATALGKRFSAVSFVVALVGLAVGAGIGWLIAEDATGVLVGALGGFIVGGLLGFLYGGYTGLPVNEQWAETFESTGGETSIAVHSAEPKAIEAAVEALRGTDARRLATCGPDGDLRDVA